MKRLWNIFWPCCLFTLAVLMFAQGLELTPWTNQVGFVYAAVILIGMALHWRVNRPVRSPSRSPPAPHGVFPT